MLLGSLLEGKSYLPSEIFVEGAFHCAILREGKCLQARSEVENEPILRPGDWRLVREEGSSACLAARPGHISVFWL